jgi:hypothetical protein
MRVAAHRLITTSVSSCLPIGNAGGATGHTLSVHQGTLLVSCPRPFQRREGAFAYPERRSAIGGAKCIADTRDSGRQGATPPSCVRLVLSALVLAAERISASDLAVLGVALLKGRRGRSELAANPL